MLKDLVWLQEMELTKLGKERLASFLYENKRAVFTGFDKQGYVKILLEYQSTPRPFKPAFWQPKKLKLL